MANDKTWEERIAHARAVNSQKKSAGVNNAPAVKTISASSGQTKSWEERIAHAKKVNAEKQRAEYEAYIKTDEYKWASENEKRLKSGLGYDVNNGQIYSFEPLTKESLQKSISWADSEIEKLKSQGASTDWFTAIGNFGLRLGGMEGVERTELNQQLSDLQSQKAVYQKYLENAEYEEAMSEIKKNGDGERFSELFAIDSRKKTILDTLGNIGSGGNIIPSRNASDITREEEIKAELKEKYGDKYDRYRELYGKGANNEFRKHLVDKMKEDIDKYPVLGTVGYTLGNVVTAPVRGIGALSDSLNKSMGNYGASTGGIFQDMSEAVVQKVNENINNTFKNEYAAGFVRTVYNAAVSGAESMITMGTFDKMGEAILGLNAAASTYKAGKERGLSDGQALTNGIAAGIFETLFEHMSLEKLRVFQASPTTSLKPFIKNVLKQSFTEGMEELGTDIANEAYDYFVNGGLSQYEQALRNGVTPKEYGQQFLAQLGETIITGALAGGGMIGAATAPTAVRGSVAQSLTDKKVGNKIRSEDEIEKIINAAKKQGGMLSKKAAKIEKQIKDGESISDRKIGQIDRKTTKIERAKVVDTILAGDEYKGISDKEKKAIRSSVLTFLSSGGQVAYEQAQVLNTENGNKVLEAAQRWEIDKVLEIKNERIERKSTNIRKAVEEHNTESLVKNTFSAVNVDGYKVNVGAVRSITDGEFEVIQDTETRATAKLSELKIEDRQARELYSNLQALATGENPLTVEAVNVALSMYNTYDNTSARAYSLWVHDAFKAGSLNIKNTVLTFSEFEEMFHNKYNGDIKEQQLREIYEIGARNLKVNPGVTRIGRKGLSKLQAEQVFILHERAKQLGLEIVLTDGKITDEEGQGVNALYIEGSNRIVMSLQSDLNLLLVHAGHEIFHWAKNQNHEVGAFLQNMVINVLKSDSKYDFNGIYNQVSAEYEGLYEDAILEEIAAQYLGVVFASEDNIRKTVAAATDEQKGFLKKMIDYLRDFIKSLKELIRIYGDSDKTVRAAVETPVDQLQYIADTFEEVLRKTAEIKKPATEEGGVKYSYAGIGAKTHDVKTLAQADRLEDIGKATPEEIRQQTGWFRGYDGKWRFELDDSNAEFRKEGDARLRQNERYRRLEELTEKLDKSNYLTDDETKELKSLEKEFEDDIWSEKYELQDYLDYPALYEAYPQLKHLSVAFDTLEPGVYGEFYRNKNMIILKRGADANLLKSALLHELQHAVQKIEGFAGGSSPGYWSNVPAEIKPGTYAQKIAERDKIGDRILNSASKEFIAAFRAHNRGEIEYSDLEKIGTEDELDLLWDYDEADREAAYLRVNDRSDYDLYMSTAGEIEARDVERRQNLNAEARKEKRPDIDRTDVVFSEDNKVGYSIVEPFADEKGVEYKNAVLLDTDFFDGISPKNWGRKLKNYVEERSKNNPFILPIVDEKGNVQQLQFAKVNERVKKDNTNSHRVINKLSSSKDNISKLTVVHIDEVISVSEEANPYYSEEHSHQWLDEHGWLHRTANVINARNGKVFNIVLDIAKARDGRIILYATSGKIKEVGNVNVSSLEIRGSRPNSNFKDNVTQRDTDVKKKYSRQLLNDTWDDIRDKMYENEVHEDIIGEIEAYIKKLTKRKLARETAVTEGLIPKYEAILKVAREFTKGSDVSAQQLADTINELMWAAHDGNLDTKQFIASVKLIAKDIISTGRKINDDKYREYEEFRKMTREETVYVSQQVYNQYVEEYGNRKNLNHACAGKIKIKPYEDKNRTGRALDDFYSELRERFPELFRGEADVYHQLYDILAAWDSIQPTTEYFSEMLGIKTVGDLEQQSLIVAEDILLEILGIKEAVKTIADKYSDKLKYQQEHYKEYYRKQAEKGRRKRRESEAIAVLNKRILRNTNRLSDMLRNETDTRHIPEAFKDAVMDFLNIFISKNEEGRDVYRIKNGVLNMVKLGNAYASYYNPAGEEGREMTQYDEDVARWIEELAITFGESIDIKTLSFEDISKVDNIVTHFCHIIKHENEMFVNGRNEKFTAWATASIEEMWNHIKKPEYAAEKKILDAEYGMLTPIYFFKTIGTTINNGTIYEEKLFKMFRDLQDGQDKWYRNIAAVKKQLADIMKRYHYSEAWKRDTTEFTLASGETIKLTAEEIMYMRALNIRETGHVNRLCHLLEGGIIVENDGRLRKFAEKKQSYEETKQAREDFKKKGGFTQADITDALKKNITMADLINIFATLTEEQELYSEALVEMMSTTGADLGNEVSKELFGIRKFTEKNYIPISVAESFLQFSVDKKAGGNIRLKNRSFTKRTTQNANATVYVRSITDIAAEHMQEMSLYNAMTIPIENFTRVFNYQKPVQEEFVEDGTMQKNTGNSYKEIFKAVYGERGIKYFEDFLKDMNGGNQMPSRDFMSKMMSMFKKSAVTGSLSVAIQQPSAIVRAMALVDPKYFVTKPYSKVDYLELLEYCPVAGIKEIGRFDTGTGLTATEWILDKGGGIKEKADALLSYLPGWMDRRTWVYIWEAVKKEAAEKTHKTGDELLEDAARRFRDVIDYTQVYDSTLSRSAYMRDKGTGAKMATAFLSEPTLSYNMVRDGLMNAKNDKNQAARSIVAFIGATLLNAMLKTLVTALRHDDEETNFFEVYLSEMPQNFLEDLIIVNSLPVVKDIISIFKGYDVNRSDMTLFSNVYNAFKVISKEEHIPTWDEWFSLFGAVSAFTGIPLNNVLKDFTAVVKTVIGLGKAPKFSWDVLGQTITESFLGETEDAVKIYRAILNGNKEIVDRYLIVDEKKIRKYVKQGYSEADALNKVMDNAENNFHSKVIEGLVSEDIRIQEAAEARIKAETDTYEALLAELTGLGFDKNDVIKAVEKYIASLEDKTYKKSESKDKTLYTSVDLTRFAESFDINKCRDVITVFKKDGKEDGDIRKELTTVLKKKYIEAWRTGNSAEVGKIRDFLEALDVGYKESTFTKWEKEANNKE